MTETHAETGLPIEKCPGRGDHATHNWNIYDPTGVKLGRVNPDGDRTCEGHNPFVDIDWDARLRVAVEATLAARIRRRNERAAFAETRNWGGRATPRPQVGPTQARRWCVQAVSSGRKSAGHSNATGCSNR